MTTHQTAMIMMGLAVVLALAHVLERLARRCGQPAVLGEILAGILLGPTPFHGALSDTVFPTRAPGDDGRVTDTPSRSGRRRRTAAPGPSP
ncbi:hypothetical protein [Streptomyces sp. NPDC047141]|uniref:hypothetical protein n=1 Tax=Streptomyces sp. NPDC047141 TaxID=3155738 RepID=UPI0033FFF6B5